MIWVASWSDTDGGAWTRARACHFAHVTDGHLHVGVLVLGLLMSIACVAQTEQGSTYRWKNLVRVEGQPDPVPAEWVSTPQGAYAHSLKIPNPVPKDSGYRRGMNSREYFDHLCKKEAGEFIFATAEGVEGLLFMRPPRRPSDSDLMERYKLEAPGIERVFQLVRPTIAARGVIFGYQFAEEPSGERGGSTSAYLRASRAHSKLARFENIEYVDAPRSRFGLTWRGLRRERDREHAIAGAEIIVVALASGEVMGVLREYVLSGGTPNVPDGIWWLNAIRCPQFAHKYKSAGSKQLSEFARRVLKPQALYQ